MDNEMLFILKMDLASPVYPQGCANNDQITQHILLSFYSLLTDERVLYVWLLPEFLFPMLCNTSQ